MAHNFLSIEIWRLFLVMLVALSFGMLSQQWLISAIVTLSGYIVWLLYQLYQLQKWLAAGAKAQLIPDNSGLWARVSQQILNLQKKSNKRKKNISKLLKRSQGIITGLPYATIVLNQHNEIDWANKISASYLNINRKKDRGQRIDNLIRLPEFRKILKQSATKEIYCSLPHDAGKKLALQLIPVQKDLKLLIARDITERENIVQMRKNFIANASHELRSPLTVIAGYLEIMQDHDAFPESLEKPLIAAIDQAFRMQRILAELLLLSRLENSTLATDANTLINLPALLLNICKDARTLISDNSHTIISTLDPRLKIKGSEVEIISVCSNLIDNAVRHTQDGTEISVQWCQDTTGKARLTVKDSGQGIAAKHIAHLSERFYRIDKGRARDQGGTGLGLAIVQHISQRHGGYLDIQSVVGQGSTFSVYFPKQRVVKCSKI